MEAVGARGGCLALSCERRRVSCASEEWWACLETRHCWVFALVSAQSLARLLWAIAACSTAVLAAAGMPRRPWCVQSRRACRVLCAVLVMEDDGAIKWAGAGRQLALVPAGSRCCKLHAARWQIGSGDGAVRTCMSSNWVGRAKKVLEAVAAGVVAYG